MKQQEQQEQPIWDLPIRIFHWLLPLLIGACWWTAKNHMLEYHRWCGYGLAFLIVFRIYWGFLGSYTAKFKQFIKSPFVVFRYAMRLVGKKNEQTTSMDNQPGHNPMGGYAVVLMLLVIGSQILLGLFAIDTDGFDGGPFADYIDYDLSRTFAEWHELLFNLLLVNIGLHIAAILFYRIVRKNNLIPAITIGKTSPNIPKHKFALMHLLIALGLAGLVVFAITQFSTTL